MFSCAWLEWNREPTIQLGCEFLMTPRQKFPFLRGSELGGSFCNTSRDNVSGIEELSLSFQGPTNDTNDTNGTNGTTSTNANETYDTYAFQFSVARLAACALLVVHA